MLMPEITVRPNQRVQQTRLTRGDFAGGIMLIAVLVATPRASSPARR